MKVHTPPSIGYVLTQRVASDVGRDPVIVHHRLLPDQTDMLSTSILIRESAGRFFGAESFFL